jgi:3,4-dihydroxy 2-butanone 4-phosphate synthase/GTP cyclohydrolase II
MPKMLETATQVSDRLANLRNLAQTYHLSLREETRPVTIALFGRTSIVFHLGLDQANLTTADWYQDSDHPYVKAIKTMLDEIANLPGLQKLEFLIADGNDPLTNLKVQLKREIFPLSQHPSSACVLFQLQTIYSFT